MQISTLIAPPPPALADPARAREAFDRQLVAILPKLRAFAWKLTSSDDKSDDLVQETVFRALRAYRSFQAGTNMRAWAFTILRNLRMNEFRQRRLEELTDEIILRSPLKGNQEDSLELSETFAAMEQLKPTHRDVLMLVRVQGHDYQHAAEFMACAIGTIKSRVNRADEALREKTGRWPAE